MLSKLPRTNLSYIKCKCTSRCLQSDNPVSSAGFTPLVLELSLIRSHLLGGEFSAFSAANAIHNSPIFRSTRYPLLLGGQRQYGMRSLPDTSAHDQQWESNPRPSDVKSNALSTTTCTHEYNF